MSYRGMYANTSTALRNAQDYLGGLKERIVMEKQLGADEKRVVDVAEPGEADIAYLGEYLLGQRITGFTLDESPCVFHIWLSSGKKLTATANSPDQYTTTLTIEVKDQPKKP
jgi:hypothetical protein